MVFSPLTSYTVGTRKYNAISNRRVDRLIVHHTAGGTNQGNIDLLSSAAREVSSTYCLITDGQLVGIVPEEYRPWTSNSPGVDADWNSVTVETVNTSGDPHWHVSDAQVEKLAQLAADLSNRYGWGGLNRNRVIGHRQVAQTACPGPYLYPLLEHIVARGNQILKPIPKVEVDPMPIRKSIPMFSGKQVAKAGTWTTLLINPKKWVTLIEGGPKEKAGTIYSTIHADAEFEVRFVYDEIKGDKLLKRAGSVVTRINRKGTHIWPFGLGRKSVQRVRVQVKPVEKKDLTVTALVTNIHYWEA